MNAEVTFVTNRTCPAYIPLPGDQPIPCPVRSGLAERERSTLPRCPCRSRWVRFPSSRLLSVLGQSNYDNGVNPEISCGEGCGRYIESAAPIELRPGTTRLAARWLNSRGQ